MAAGIMSRLTFLTLLLMVSSSVHCKRYHLQGWNVTNNNRLKQFEAAQGIGHYRLIPAVEDHNLLLSDNGTFGLCFFSFNGTGSYYLSVVMGTNSSSSAVVVWTANRNKPISENGNLYLGDNGSVELVDSDGKSVWNSPHGATISGIDLRENGNMILYNMTGGIAWQSFDEPTDVLLEGQMVYSGQRLSSSTSSSTMAIGNFQLTIEPSGVGFFLSLPNQKPQLYFLWNLWNQGNLPADSSSITIACPTYVTALQYTAAKINMYFKKNGTGAGDPCGPNLSAFFSDTAESLHYLKLDHAGNLVQISYDPQLATWRTGTPLLKPLLGPCLPMTCEAHSICTATAECKCLDSSRSSSSNTSSRSSCSAPSDPPLACNELEAKNHHFKNVSGASYFSNRYTKADKVSTLDDCWSLCLSNCSCNALFYNKQSGSCYFVDSLHGSLTADSTTDAFLKLQNLELVSPKKQNHIKAITFGVSGGTIFFMLCVAFMAVWLWRKQMDKIANTLDAALQGSAHRFSYKELELATGKFSSMIGKGGFGPVYEGLLADGKKVAIKRLESTKQGQKEFIAEVNSIGSISHVNIVKLCGFCAERSHRMLVYEYVANGSLDKWLFDDEKQGFCLDWKTRYNIALGLARGLAYLHEESAQLIMHLDIKPQNILLDGQFVAKVSDFGMSKLLMNRHVSQASTSVRGTPGYLAPEWLLHSVATKKCDVYSYGMVLLELVGGRRNLDSSAAHSSDQALGWYFPAWAVNRIREGKLMDIVDQRIAEQVSEQEAKTLIHVALWCIQETPSMRPPMDSVVQMLEGHREVLEPQFCFHFALQSPGIITISTTSKEDSITI